MVGFITVGGGSRFFVFLMPLIIWRLGRKSYYQAKVYYHAKVKGCRILLVLAEKGISLTGNAVERRGDMIQIRKLLGVFVFVYEFP